MGELTLRFLHIDDQRSFEAAIEEFRDNLPAFDFALSRDRCESFPQYVDMCERWSRGVALPDGFVPCSFFVGVVDGEVVGRLSLRHELNDFLSKYGGHIGYGVRPSMRGRGYATQMLKQALPMCAQRKIQRPILFCDIDNIASRRTIEHCGGEFEGVVDAPTPGQKFRRYGINVIPSSRFS
jgi:predicted acetyltransferase